MADRGERPETDRQRRDLLKGVALAPAAAAAPILGGAGEAQALIATPEQRAPRYRETEHVRAFYRTNAR
ncbi:formate dehydrogenase [Salinarimonas sp.]|uniref:formate dehydrogenase n=1 Tax=Salinarimonas sp. TaxID=2766526 RepID=UPI0032D8B64E